jgi:hypothetical protein
MCQEIYYTSAPRGLQPGSRGYCTVAATTGMSPPLIARLEALSGNPSARDELETVTWSYLLLTLGGKTHRVLSRVGPAGLDHSGRAAKFAHHVVLEESECAPEGPAWMLGLPGFLHDQWDRNVRFLEPRRPPAAGAESRPTGGVEYALGEKLAAMFIEQPRRSIFLTMAPGFDCLPIVQAAISQLPREVRWRATFSTYSTGLGSDVECKWRGVWEGSAEARRLQSSAEILVLHLNEASFGQPDSHDAESLDRRRIGSPEPALAQKSGSAFEHPTFEGDSVFSGIPPAPPRIAPGMRRTRITPFVAGTILGAGAASAIAIGLNLQRKPAEPAKAKVESSSNPSVEPLIMEKVIDAENLPNGTPRNNP